MKTIKLLGRIFINIVGKFSVTYVTQYPEQLLDLNLDFDRGPILMLC